MQTQPPEKVKSLFAELFTLIGESLIDNQIENREEFETLHNKMFEVMKEDKAIPH